MTSNFQEFLKLFWKTFQTRIQHLFFILVIIRLIVYIPVGKIPSGLFDLFINNPYLAFLDIFTGGAAANFSIFSLGVYPYLASQVISQVMMLVLPRSWQRLFEDELNGREKFDLLVTIITIATGIFTASI